MIEFPEAQVIARQMREALQGRRIVQAVRGNVVHKFAFYNHTPEEYADLLNGKTLGAAEGDGSFILLRVEGEQVLLFGDGGERIFLHPDGANLPKKYHFLLGFSDGAHLTITIQGWGFAQLIPQSGFPPAYYADKQRISPLSTAFSFDYFLSLFGELKAGDKRSVKYFLISKPGVWGIGNGCLQDILFRARLHPRQPAEALNDSEQRGLYEAIRSILQEMVDLGGRDCETDLFGQAGGYRRLMCNETAGQPCPICGTPVEKAQYLGGAVYFCPYCQD